MKETANEKEYLDKLQVGTKHVEGGRVEQGGTKYVESGGEEQGGTKYVESGGVD